MQGLQNGLTFHAYQLRLVGHIGHRRKAVAEGQEAELFLLTWSEHLEGRDEHLKDASHDLQPSGLAFGPQGIAPSGLAFGRLVGKKDMLLCPPVSCPASYAQMDSSVLDTIIRMCVYILLTFKNPLASACKGYRMG